MKPYIIPSKDGGYGSIGGFALRYKILLKSPTLISEDTNGVVSHYVAFSFIQYKSNSNIYPTRGEYILDRGWNGKTITVSALRYSSNKGVFGNYDLTIYGIRR